MNSQTLKLISAFDTSDPTNLERQLSQAEANTDEAIKSLSSAAMPLLSATDVKTAAYTAKVEELVVCEGTFVLTLPIATKKNVTRYCGVLVRSGTVTVSCVSGNVQGAAADALATNGLRLYVSDGSGWWRAP